MITLGQLTGFVRGDPCTGKKQFDTYAAAEREIGKLISKNAHRPHLGVLTAYLCGECRHYHLGHIPPEEKGAKGWTRHRRR